MLTDIGDPGEEIVSALGSKKSKSFNYDLTFDRLQDVFQEKENPNYIREMFSICEKTMLNNT